MELTQEIIRSLVHYNPDTGDVVWLERSELNAPQMVHYAKWNNRNAGKIVGTIHHGYICAPIFGKKYKVHRLIWLYVHGQFPADQIDHINHISDDNRLCNLRAVTNSQNQKNRSKNSNNKSGHNGVYRHKCGKWVVKLHSKGKHNYAGIYTDLDEAIRVRDKLKRKLGFHHNHAV
jgi:hypothetical protein